MNTNLIYLAAGVVALLLLANRAPTRALVPAALALAVVLVTVATLSDGPDALVRVIDALAHLLHGSGAHGARAGQSSSWASTASWSEASSMR